MNDQPREFDQQGDLDAFDQMLIALYVRSGITVDSLAYSETFDRIYDELKRKGDPRPQGEVFRRLLMLRKSGRLPRLDLHMGGSSSSEKLSA